MLIASRAFVVQIDTASSLSTDSFTGRVDHIVSGETAHFTQLEDLLAFMKSMLDADSAADQNSATQSLASLGKSERRQCAASQRAAPLGGWPSRPQKKCAMPSTNPLGLAPGATG